MTAASRTRSRVAFIQVDGVRLRAVDVGSGPAIVLIHGWGLDLDMWQPQIDSLAACRRLIAFDRRGFGDSPGTPSIAGDVEDLLMLLDALALPQASLVGMSQGARVALRFALAHAQRVSSLVLDGAPGEGAAEDPTAGEVPVKDYRRLLQQHGVDAFRQAWREHPFTRLHQPTAQTRALLDAILARCPARSLDAAASVPAPLGRRLEAIASRALVINGEHDSSARHDAARVLAARLPNAARAVIPQAGHLCNLDAPGDYNALVAGFTA